MKNDKKNKICKAKKRPEPEGSWPLNIAFEHDFSVNVNSLTHHHYVSHFQNNELHIKGNFN